MPNGRRGPDWVKDFEKELVDFIKDLTNFKVIKNLGATSCWEGESRLIIEAPNHYGKNYATKLNQRVHIRMDEFDIVTHHDKPEIRKYLGDIYRLVGFYENGWMPTAKVARESRESFDKICTILKLRPPGYRRC